MVGQMNPLMLMLMMQNQGGGSNGAESQSGDQTEMMLRMMMPEMFETETNAVWSDGVTAGSARVGGTEGIGVIGLLLMPADDVIDRPTYRVTVHATIKLNDEERKEQLLKLGNAFIGWANDPKLDKRMETALEAHVKDAPQREVMKAAKVMK